MAKGIKTGGGSRQGKPNKSTQYVREAIALIAQRNVGNFEIWLGQVATEDPGKAAELFLKAIEYRQGWRRYCDPHQQPGHRPCLAPQQPKAGPQG
jgi:hypothetical protein